MNLRMDCAAVRQCGSVRHCERQCVAVRAVVCALSARYGAAARLVVYCSARDSMRLSSSAAVCGSALGSVWQCPRRCCPAVRGSVRQCAAVCGSVRQCAVVCGSVRQCVCGSAAVCGSVAVAGSVCQCAWLSAAVRVAVCGGVW
jgi:hypothetical protein